MNDSSTSDPDEGDDVACGLKARACKLIDSLVRDDGARVEAFEALLVRASDLWRRKQAMEGSKSDTRDLLGEVLFSRLRLALRELQENEDPVSEIRSAEWVIGMLFAGTALTDFASALDRAMLESSRPQDFSFAGRADFISVEEVLQLLSSGKYNGVLGIEKDDNRIDMYLRGGKVVFLDPHALVRRVLPGHDSLNYREIPAKLIKQAEAIKSQHGTPLLLGLVELGFLKEGELPDLLQNLGLEVFYEFLSNPDVCTFFYRKLDSMPDFVGDYGHPMPVTPILLEGSKRIDDWQAMLRVFPDPSQPVKPVDDMLARIAELDLSVLEIKLLAMINGDTSPRQLAPAIGLPLFEVYQHLVRYGRDGVLVLEGGSEALADVACTLEETMAMAFEVLDANDDDLSRKNALDDALGDPFAGFGEQPVETDGAGDGESFLDILAKGEFSKGPDS